MGGRVGGGAVGEEEGVECRHARVVGGGERTADSGSSSSRSGKTSARGTRRPVQFDTGHAGAKGRKPPGRNCTPQTRPASVSFWVNRPSPTPATSAEAFASADGAPIAPYRWKTMFTDGWGTTWVAYGSGSSQSISQ